NECRQMLHTAYLHNGPAAVRYPRGNGLGVQVHSQLTAMEIGKGEVLALLNEQHEDCISILAFGSRVQPALEAAQAFAARHEAAVRVVNMRYVKPLDEQLLDDIADSTALFVTVEEHAVMGGAGSAVNEYLAKAQIVKPVCNLGLDDTFMQQAAHSQMLRQAGLDAQGIEKSIEQAWLKVMHTAP
ncbi:MAG: 1-deoxy-D-xylulose-5-phosphate synthase, partial [Acinetobacter sp.]|nr:1-deoxy-D-xylulose-5-phosphate synthase [Acinetobacter sp.]